MKKFKLFSLVALLFVGFSGVAYPWGAAGGDGKDYKALQETAVFFNNSGATMTAGEAAILDTSFGGVVTGTTLGSYVLSPSKSAMGFSKTDSRLVVGVVKTTASDQRPVVIVTKGPVQALADDSSDAVTNRSAVGVSGLAGSNNIGGGTELGVALEGGDGTDTGTITIWVDPSGAD